MSGIFQPKFSIKRLLEIFYYNLMSMLFARDCHQCNDWPRIGLTSAPIASYGDAHKNLIKLFKCDLYLLSCLPQ